MPFSWCEDGLDAIIYLLVSVVVGFNTMSVVHQLLESVIQSVFQDVITSINFQENGYLSSWNRCSGNFDRCDSRALDLEIPHPTNWTIPNRHDIHADMNLRNFVPWNSDAAGLAKTNHFVKVQANNSFHAVIWYLHNYIMFHKSYPLYQLFSTSVVQFHVICYICVSSKN